MSIKHEKDGEKEYMSEKYRPDFEIERTDQPIFHETKAFGEDVVDRAEGLLDEIADLKEQGSKDADLIRSLEGWVSSLLKDARGHLKENLNSGKFILFVNEAIAVESLKEEFASSFSESNLSTVEAKVAEAFKEGTISDKLFVEMLKVHVSNFKTAQREFREKLPEFQTRFRQRVEKAITDGRLPITQEEFRNRLARTSVKYRDLILPGVKSKGSEGVGWCDIETRTVNIVSHTPTMGQEWKPEDKNSTLTHEFVHSTLTSEGDIRWLNEAITETITLELEGREEWEGAYHEERQNMRKLEKDGIPRDLLYRAEIEAYDVQDKQSTFAYKALKEKIKEIYPQGQEIFRSMNG